ncbi:ATP-binding protein [Actinomadura fibrosa]|uniref:ATP-binding protein n=1 Tax=Actinomadura fibrosa TaxID=111802 RepID=A0ABW2X8X6_9ACTN|nr:hypothetical protein [Actinomadura fibrosa]
MDDAKMPELATGGVWAWRLPLDESGPAAARALLGEAMAGLGLGRDVIEDGRLAVSETATNALRYGRPVLGVGPPTSPELWVWARTVPAPQLVVSVFDGARDALPRASGAGLLDEHGKGLGLLGGVTSAWGSSPTRSRLAEQVVRGKTVWFALPLPCQWAGRSFEVHPGTAAQCLLLNVTRRGFQGTCGSEDRGVCLVALQGLNVWVHRQHFCWWASPKRYVRRPLIDLQETAEEIVRHLDRFPSAH